MEPDQTVAVIAARQHGLITRRQALDAGITSAGIHHRVVTGRWRRVHSGVYAIAGSPATDRQSLMAACLAAGDTALASHLSAATLLGIVDRSDESQITVPADRSPELNGVRVFRSRDLGPTDRCVADRIPTTRPPRVLLDLASVLDPTSLERVLDDALASRRLTLAQLDSRVSAAGGGRSGLALLRRLIQERWGEGHPLNSFERDIFRLLAGHGMAPTATQYSLEMPSGLRLRLDVAYPERRFGIEGQSFRWHSGKGSWRNDQGRLAELHAIGWHVLPVTPDDLTERPLWIVGQVALGLSRSIAI